MRKLLTILALSFIFTSVIRANPSVPSNIVKWHYESLHEVILDEPLINFALNYIHNSVAEISKCPPRFFTIEISQSDGIISISATAHLATDKPIIYDDIYNLKSAPVYSIGYVVHDDAVFHINATHETHIAYQTLSETSQFIHAVDYLSYYDGTYEWEFTIENGMLNLITEILGF